MSEQIYGPQPAVVAPLPGWPLSVVLVDTSWHLVCGLRPAQRRRARALASFLPALTCPEASRRPASASQGATTARRATERPWGVEWERLEQ